MNLIKHSIIAFTFVISIFSNLSASYSLTPAAMSGLAMNPYSDKYRLPKLIEMIEKRSASIDIGNKFEDSFMLNLSVQLDVELSLLEDRLNEYIEHCENHIVQGCERIKNNQSYNPPFIGGFHTLKQEEEYVEYLRDCLLLVEQLRNKYCLPM